MPLNEEEGFGRAATVVIVPVLFAAGFVQAIEWTGLFSFVDELHKWIRGGIYVALGWVIWLPTVMVAGCVEDALEYRRREKFERLRRLEEAGPILKEFFVFFCIDVPNDISVGDAWNCRNVIEDGLKEKRGENALEEWEDLERTLERYWDDDYVWKYYKVEKPDFYELINVIKALRDQNGKFSEIEPDDVAKVFRGDI